jgi:hypothetical protein
MALKGDRIVVHAVVDYFMNQPAERGGVAVISTIASGVAMDNALQTVHYSTTSSAVKAVGVLLNDVVDIDLSRWHLNEHKDEVPKGSKVTLVKIGQITTDYLVSGITITSTSNTAYVGAEGRFTNVPPGGGATVGTFDTAKDSEGFARISVNIP